MDRSTIDKIGIVVGIIALVVPMRWWLRSVLTFIGTAFFGDLILRLPWIRKLPEAEPLKIYFTLCFFYIVLLLSWDPIRQEYFKEQERYVLQKQMSELKRE